MTEKLKSLYRTAHVEQTWDDLRGRDALDDYLVEAVRIAGKVLQDAGYDDVAAHSEDWHLHYAGVVREDLSPEVRHALEIMWHVRTLRDQLDRKNAQGAAVEAVRLTQHVEHFNVDRAFLKPVVARMTSNRNLENEQTVSDEQILEIVNDPRYPTREKQASKLGIGKRQLQKRLTAIKNKKREP